jgi:hypothetical protein
MVSENSRGTGEQIGLVASWALTISLFLEEAEFKKKKKEVAQVSEIFMATMRKKVLNGEEAGWIFFSCESVFYD